MGNVHFIVVVLEPHVEAQKEVVRVSTLFLLSVGVVTDVLSVSMPPIVHPFSFLSRVNDWKHSEVVERVVFLKVFNVESVNSIFSSVRYSKVVPLSVRICAVVWFQIEVVFIFRSLNCSTKVSALEP